LLAWLSPGFPIGAFSYSHGLEAAVASGAVHDRASLEAWTAAVVVHGSGRMDADILCAAHRAGRAGDPVALTEANRRGIAFRATAELALEAGQQGEAFLATCRAAWPEPFIEGWAEHLADPHPPLSPGQSHLKALPLDGGGLGGGDHAASPVRSGYQAPNSPPPRPSLIKGEGVSRPNAITLPLSRIAGEGAERSEAGEGFGYRTAPEGVCHSAVFGAVAARAGIALADALTGYLQALAANLVSAGLRLGIIGQTDGQRILSALEPAVGRAAAAATTRDPSDFGAATFAVDLASMAHETQYTRLFRS
jgi:urease accessory protein UreF